MTVSADRGPGVHPVILRVPDDRRGSRGRPQVAYLSGYARRAVELSARFSGARLETLAKDAAGVPQPSRGFWWSLTHKPAYVGGVVAPRPVGIDIERLRPVDAALFRRVGRDDEWNLSATDKTELFFRFWTAKETVLKASGVGFKGISGCRVTAVTDRHHLALDFQGRLWQVEHRYFDGHIATVLHGGAPVVWSLLNEDLLPL